MSFASADRDDPLRRLDQTARLADLTGFYTVQAADGLGDPLGVVRITGVAGEVHDHAVGVGLDHVDGDHGAGGLLDGGVTRAMPCGSESSWTRMVIE
jgi:hypothetical protein